MTLGEVRVYLEQFHEHLNAGNQALYQEAVDLQRDTHRDILGLPDPPQFQR